MNAFTLSKSPCGSLTFWAVRHSHTNLLAHGPFMLKRDALAYVQAIEPLLPWADLTTKDAVEQRLTPEIAQAMTAANRTIRDADPTRYRGVSW